MTFASGVTALLESVMRPVREAFDDCAKTECAENIINSASVMMRIKMSQRSRESCQTARQISAGLPSSKRTLSTRPRELVTNLRRSISPNPRAVQQRTSVVAGGRTAGQRDSAYNGVKDECELGRSC